MEALPLRGQSNATGLPVKEFLPQPVLKLGYLSADGTMREVEVVRRGRKAAEAGCGLKGAQSIERRQWWRAVIHMHS